MPPTTGVPLVLGGKERTVRYTAGALSAAEVELGKSVLQALEALATTLSFRDMTVLLWAGLQHEENGPTLKEVGELIAPPMKPVIDAVTKALEPWFELRGEPTTPSAPEGKKKGRR